MMHFGGVAECSGEERAEAGQGARRGRESCGSGGAVGKPSGSRGAKRAHDEERGRKDTISVEPRAGVVDGRVGASVRGDALEAFVERVDPPRHAGLTEPLRRTPRGSLGS